MKNQKITVVILNFNYELYVPKAIRSVLRQTQACHKLIIVDDGSTDNSRQIIRDTIEDAGQEIVFVEKENGGMISAANAAFPHIKSEYVLFLDADDELLDHCIESVSAELGVAPALLHFPLNLITESGTVFGTFPNLRRYSLSEGEGLDELLRPGFYIKTSTSGNVYSADALSKLFPIPDCNLSQLTGYDSRMPLDAYLTNKIIYFGPVKCLIRPLGNYRIHTNNSGAGRTVWNSEQKRIRTLALLQNDIEFFSDRGIENFSAIILRDPRLLLNIAIQNRIGSTNLSNKNFSVTCQRIASSIKANIISRVLPVSHAALIYSLLIFLPVIPRFIIKIFIK